MITNQTQSIIDPPLVSNLQFPSGHNRRAPASGRAPERRRQTLAAILLNELSH